MVVVRAKWVIVVDNAHKKLVVVVVLISAWGAINEVVKSLAMSSNDDAHIHVRPNDQQVLLDLQQESVLMTFASPLSSHGEQR